MKTVGVCGFFSFEKKDHGGQPVKTRELYYALVNEFNANDVLFVDTYNWKKRPLSLIIRIMILMSRCKNIIILPAQNGLKIFAPLFIFLNIFFHRKLHYIVIGGWLPNILSKNKRLCKQISKFNTVFVETKYMAYSLNNLDLTNVIVLNNFKELQPVNENKLKLYIQEPYKLCTFSRVTREKGIKDAVDTVIRVNKLFGKTVFTLDIFGQVDECYINTFEELKNTFPDYICYKGIVEPDKSVEVLKDYFALLFPTLYKTEGIPGTIIDSYFAGVPVIASKWNSFDDVVDDGITGIGFELGNMENFYEVLYKVAKNPKVLTNMKKSCIKKAMDYTPSIVIIKLLRYL